MAEPDNTKPEGNVELANGRAYRSSMPLRARGSVALLRGWPIGLTVAAAAFVFIAVAAATMLGGCHNVRRERLQANRIRRPIQAIWVTRWDYKSPADISKIMANCKKAGFNTILFQVRGSGTVFYPSRIEPWADELGGRDPGFDPLAVACRQAHSRGMELHAWVNVIPGWRGDDPPTNRRQLYHTHPDWFWRDSRGRREPLGWYNNLNPCYPEVRKYIVDLMGELVSRYPLDGLHLDYIRFPNEWNEAYPRGASVPDYPRDRRTLALFASATGKTPDDAPRLWDRWRTDQITALVRSLRRMMRGVKPNCRLSAAVGALPNRARRHHFQDARAWLLEGLLDAVYPMNYASHMPTYQRCLTTWSVMSLRIPVVTGIMFDRRDASTVIEQLSDARKSGHHFAAFAYNSLFERLDPRGRRIADEQSASRAQLRKRVVPVIRRRASARG